MTPADPVHAALAGLVLFFVPGLVFLALTRRAPGTLRTDEALFLAVGVSVLTSAWVALVLAEAGIFSLRNAALVEVAAAALACGLGRRRLAPPIPRPPTLRALVPAAVLLAVAFALQARPTEWIFGGRDPGTYVNAMALIARTGGLVLTDEAVRSIPPDAVELFYREPASADFNWGRFMGFPLERPETGRVYAEFFHLFPVFGAYLFEAMGTRGALATPPVFGILATLAVYFALRRLFSDAVALVGAGLLAINVLQVWFGRYPMSETMSQFLIFLGLLAFTGWEADGSPAWGALAGAAFGASLLVRIDSVLILAPLAAYIVIRRGRGDLTWRQVAPLLAALGFFLVHVAIHATFWSWKYVLDIVNRPYWQQPTWVWVAVGVGTVAACAFAHRVLPPLFGRLDARADRVRTAVAAVVVVLAVYTYFARPLLSQWAGAHNNVGPAWENPALLHALGFHRLAAQDAQALYRFGWFVHPLGLILAVGGLVTIVRRGERRHLLFALLVLTFALFYFYKMRVWHDYFFAMRRVIPVILPATMACVAYALVELWRRAGPRRLVALASGVALLGLYGFETRRIVAWGKKEWEGAVPFVADLARRFGPEDVVVFEQVKSLHVLSLPLWAQHGVNVLELARFNPDAEKLRRLVEAWRSRYRNIYFVHTYNTDLCGLFLQTIGDHRFGAYEWERAYGAPPRVPVWHSWAFRISRVVPPQDLPVPPLPEVDIGGSDDFQVSGFFDKEGGGDHTYRWTGSCGSVYLPGARAGQDLVIVGSRGRRPYDTPRMKPAVVRVSLAGRPLGTFEPGPDWTEHRLRLPAPLPPGAPVLRFDVPSWRPLNVMPGSTDTRDLGVMIDRIRIEPVG